MKLKAWMRALVWLGLGGGIGFFAGYQLGYNKDKSEIIADCGERITEAENNAKKKYNDDMNAVVKESRKIIDDIREQSRKALDAQREYLGAKDDETVSIGQIEMDIGQDDVNDDSLMYEPPEMPDEEEEEIPQLHPEDLKPFGITRAEYLRNEKGYDQVELDYYTEDTVIFDPEREEKWTHPEQLLGLGWKAMFISNDDKPVWETYVQNDTMEILYKITRIDDSFERLYEEE